MKAAITGFEKTGKTVLFNAITGMNIPINYGQTSEQTIHEGIAIVNDPRIPVLVKIFNPKKTTFATIQYLDLPGLSKSDSVRNLKIIEQMKDAEVLVHVIRVFDDLASPHPMNSIDMERDIKSFENELILSDYVFVEKRIERISNNLKRGMKENTQELAVFEKMKAHLESEQPLRKLIFSEDEERLLLPYKFVSNKPIIHVVNHSEQIDSDLKEKIKMLKLAYENHSQSSLISLCASLEREISDLPIDERGAFLKELSISEPASSVLVRESYRLLGLISFLTVGEDEVRAWTIKKGMNAKEAGGRIHSDIEKGFIRAEVISYDDFIACGSLKIAREKGLLRLEGKTYIVQDGDIVNFRFNV